MLTIGYLLKVPTLYWTGLLKAFTPVPEAVTCKYCFNLGDKIKVILFSVRCIGIMF